MRGGGDLQFPRGSFRTLNTEPSTIRATGHPSRRRAWRRPHPREGPVSWFAVALRMAGSTTTGRSAVSSITTTSATQAASIARVENPSDDVDFTGPTLRGGIGGILRATPPPLNNAGDEFCVSWWCKRGCYMRPQGHSCFFLLARRASKLVGIHSRPCGGPGSCHSCTHLTGGRRV